MTHRMGLQRLHNAELIEFLSQILQITSQAGPLPAKVSETVAALQGSLLRLQAMHKSDPASLITGELLQLDELRDNLYTGLLAFCRSFSWHNEASLVQHAAAIVHVIENYGTGSDVTRLPYSDESASLQSLLNDLARPDLQAAITGTGADRWIAPLKLANERFRARFIDRNEEQSRKEFLLSMKQQRGEAASAYDSFLRTLDAARIMGEAGLDELSARINSLTESQRTVLAQRAGRAKAQAAKEPGTPA